MEEEGRGGVVPSRVHYRGMHFWNIPRTIFGITSLMPVEKGEPEPSVQVVRMVPFHDSPRAAVLPNKQALNRNVLPLSRDVTIVCARYNYQLYVGDGI